MQPTFPVLATLRETLEGFVTTEARLAATALLLAVGIVTALVLTPRAVRVVHSLVRDRVLGSEHVPGRCRSSTGGSR